MGSKVKQRCIHSEIMTFSTAGVRSVKNRHLWKQVGEENGGCTECKGAQWHEKETTCRFPNISDVKCQSQIENANKIIRQH